MFILTCFACLLTFLVIGLVISACQKGCNPTESIRLIYWIITCIVIWFLRFHVGMNVPIINFFYMAWKIIVTMIVSALTVQMGIHGFKKGTHVCDYLLNICTLITIWLL